MTEMTASEQAVAKVTHGTPVAYHGSITEVHGPATVVGPCYCRHCSAISNDWSRVELELENGRPLVHVRRSSFSLVSEVSEGCEPR